MRNFKKIAFILAGGKGTRLWPLSRENYPKQFVEFKDGLSLFQMTLKRTLALFGPKDIFIISQDPYKFTVFNQIELAPGLSKPVKDILKRNIVLEPVSKNTLPAILYPIKQLEATCGLGDRDLIFVFPSDHVIEPLASFKACMAKGERLSRHEKIVIFGVRPSYPKEGYGYILAKDRFGQGFLVDRFIEKPSLKKADTLLKRNAFWNAGIFCFSKKVLLEELAAYQPLMYRHYLRPYPDFARRFKFIPKNSIDYGIMQKTRRAVVVKMNLRWSDLGTWDNFLQFYTHEKGNYNIGKVEFLDSRNCFAYSKNRLVCLVGLKDVIAIDAADSVLLVKKGYSDRVKDLVSIIDRKGDVHSKDSTTVYRPWGYYTVLHEQDGYKVKEIGIYPKKSLSLQKHKHRSEHWNVVSGEARLLVGKRKLKVRKNESVFVPKDTLHKIYNPTDKTTKIIEVQIGGYIAEDDIVRYDDYH